VPLEEMQSSKKKSHSRIPSMETYCQKVAKLVVGDPKEMAK
jgi:hypothetical protein